MRKQTKLVAVLSAAALLAIGASMTSFAAAAHWDLQDDEWVYLDKNGDRVTDEWKKSNGKWYYLDNDGIMAKDQLIDYGDYRYYVDETGVKVTNAWVSMDNDDYMANDNNDEVDTVWFYFDGKGKAVGYNATEEKTVKKESYGDNKTGYFVFDNNGCMLSGWQKVEREGEDYYYYLGDENEGWAYIGWHELDTDDELHTDKEGNPYEEAKWFYFDSKGKAYTDVTKKIGNKWYTFQDNGIMKTNWNTGTPSAPASDSRAYYDDENGIGNREVNWVYAYMPSEDDSYWDDQYWYYLNNKGVAFNGDNTGYWTPDHEETDSEIAAKVIKKQTYLFGVTGRMLTGLKEIKSRVEREGGADLIPGTYYFTEDDDHTAVEGQMYKNKKATIDVDGEDITFYFQENGAAYERTIISGYVYADKNWLDVDYDGALIKSYGDGNTYQIIQAPTPLKEKGKSTDAVKTGDYIAVNGNGKIKKGGSFTDVDGRKVTMDGYTVKKVEDSDKNPVGQDKWVKN